MLALLALLPAYGRPLDPAAFAALDAGAGLITTAAPSSIDPTTGIWSVDGEDLQGVLSDEGAWVFAFTSLLVAGDVEVLSSTAAPRPIAILSQGDLLLSATLDARGAGHLDQTGGGAGTGESGAGFGGPGEVGASGLPGQPWGDLVRRLDLGSGGGLGTTDVRGGGAVQLRASALLTVSGSILVDGQGVDGAPGASGGGVVLWGGAGSACTSTISALGGQPTTDAQGGGGRIVLVGVDATACTLLGVDSAGLPSEVGSLVQTADADADGWPASHDPDDADDAVFPWATELCDGVDRDADGRLGEVTHFARTGWGMAAAVAAGDAAFPGRTGSVAVGGRLRVPAGTRPSEIVYREALPASAGARDVTIQVDRALLPGAQGLRFAIGDATRWIGVTPGVGAPRLLYGDRGPQTVAITSDTALTGAFSEAPPFEVTFSIGASEVDVVFTNALGESVSGTATLALDPTALAALLIGDGAAEVYAIDAFSAESVADADADGVVDACDTCPVGDDTTDTDGDGVPDACDPCPLDDPDDTDGDGVCDSVDVCPTFDDTEDADSDGVPDGCDICALGDDTLDADGDGVPDACDPCPLDDPDDTDGDGVCDSDDVCPTFDDTEDADSDGIPDGCDLCPLGDDTLDADGDGVPDACDPCPLDDPDDTDGDGICDTDDVCDGFDDEDDQDGDGIPDGCDPCPDGPCDDDCPDGDADGDGVCDAVDRCPGFDDAIDADGDGWPDDCDLCPSVASPANGDWDGDGVGDACDPCPLDNPDDSTGDGFCDSCTDGDGDGSCDEADLCTGNDATGDADGDGWCADRDCDDDNAAVYPGAPEICDGLDNACTGVAPDEDGDLDGDGFTICQGDCADQDPARRPGATELCNGIDDDCDGALGADEVDADGDGALACDDCDDDEPLASPAFPEVCGDGIDNDCDGEPDPACPIVVPEGAVPDDGGGCTTAPGSPASLIWGLPLLLLVRRRVGGAA